MWHTMNVVFYVVYLSSTNTNLILNDMLIMWKENRWFHKMGNASMVSFKGTL